MNQNLSFDPKKILIVDIDKVRPNSWNPKDKNTKELEAIERGIDAKGLLEPIVVRENKGYEIIDGEQRWTAMKNRGAKKIAIYNMGVVDDDTAKELTIEYQLQVPWDELKYAQFVLDLTAYADLGDLVLPEEEDRLRELVKLAQFNFNMVEDKPLSEFVEEDMRTLVFDLEKEAFEIVMEAIKVMKTQGDGKMKEGTALELICAEYMAL